MSHGLSGLLESRGARADGMDVSPEARLFLEGYFLKQTKPHERDRLKHVGRLGEV